MSGSGAPWAATQGKVEVEISMKSFYLAAAMATAALSLGGCAESISEPTALQPLPAGAIGTLHVSDVTVDAAPGVEIPGFALTAIDDKVKSYIRMEAPAVMAVGPGAYQMKIHITRFERGNPVARAMLIGLGQIHLEGTVELCDVSGNVVARYTVVKDFALGGIIGATTRVVDVEDGFAKSVAEIVKAKS
jgi:hypothetical protein